MSPPTAKELGRILPDNIRLLSSLIARKPTAHTKKWASVPEQSFFYYTRTNTINLIHSMNEMLIENGWPFPPLFDVNQELELLSKDFDLDKRFGMGIFRQLLLQRSLHRRFLSSSIRSEPKTRAMMYEFHYVRNFRRLYRKLFEIWSKDKVLEKKKAVLSDIRKCYERKLWSACISTALPLLDLLMRDVLVSNSLNATIQLMTQALYTHAGLTANAFKPGYAVEHLPFNNISHNTFARSLEGDLRLPGIYLASFFEFANPYYAWYLLASKNAPEKLNRHAVIHCAGDYWSRANAIKLLCFLELTRRMRPFFRILIHGETVAMDVIESLRSEFG